MKKALRVILPILLALMILASAIWYLLVYDPDFTRDTILSAARDFDKGGHHKTAALLYDLAYLQSDGGDDVAIELANHYKSIGNYTKAEYTLSSAISDGGTVDLYIALCQTYVEQDKILDAVNMLSNIKDKSIKSQIDALRPAAPTFDPEPGFYSQYITVSVKSEMADLYVNSKGEYPSTHETPNRKQAVADHVTAYIQDYFKGREPEPEQIPHYDFTSLSVTLPEGETTIYAVSIDSNNLVSELAIHGYTIGGVIKQITLTDPALDSYVRGLLNFGATRAIYTNDLWPITHMELPKNVSDFKDLIYFPYLKSLTITDCGAANLTILSNLTELKQLLITNAQLSQDSLKAIGTLRSLEKLTLSGCGISTISHLENLTNLTYLDLSGNTLRNINVFTGFAKLQELYMGSNALTDLSALSGLMDLKILDVSHNSLQSLKPIFGLTKLETLKAGSNALETVDGIGSLTGLKTLSLDQNLLSNISYISGCTALTELNVANNSIKDISVVARLPKLVRLDLSHNKVSAFPPFTKEHPLSSVKAAHNVLTKLDELKNLQSLYFLDVDYNEKLSSLDPLLSCTNLMQVNCYGTKVSKDPFPKKQGVVVNLDPSVQ